MSGANIGYIRVSSADQNLDRQLEGIELDKTFEDKASGKNTKRPGLEACLEYIRDGDTLHVHSIDRLARNLVDLQGLVNQLLGKGISIEFHKENLKFYADVEANPCQNLMLQMLGAFSEFERNLIRERQREGIAIAKKAGKHLGRKASLSDADIARAQEEHRNGKSVIELAREFGVSRQTMHKYAKGA